jgi:hypothetical protein
VADGVDRNMHRKRMDAGAAVTFGANMKAYMTAQGTSWLWDPEFAPVVWPPSEFRRLALDLAWPNLQGALSDKVAVVMPAVLIALLGNGILIRYRHSAPKTARLSLILIGVFAAILGVTGWTLHNYYLLDARYDPAAAFCGAVERVRRDAQGGRRALSWTIDHSMTPTSRKPCVQ